MHHTGEVVATSVYVKNQDRQFLLDKVLQRPSRKEALVFVFSRFGFLDSALETDTVARKWDLGFQAPPGSPHVPGERIGQVHRAKSQYHLQQLPASPTSGETGFFCHGARLRASFPITLPQSVCCAGEDSGLPSPCGPWPGFRGTARHHCRCGSGM